MRFLKFFVFIFGIFLFLNAYADLLIVSKDDSVKAAEILQSYLQKITGKTIEIKDNPEKDLSNIFIGKAAEEISDNYRYKGLEHDGIVIKNIGKDILLFGGSQRGTIYAVYTFLEDFTGCKWWTAKDEYIPINPDFTLPEADVFFNPSLFYRDPLFRGIEAYPEFAIKMKVNGHWNKIPQSLGGNSSILGFCHTFNKFLPPEKYFKDHPEWYSEVDGIRKPLQPCLTNKEMEKEMLKNIIESLEQNPGTEMISISQNDGHKYCTCQKCMKLIKSEGSPSGPNIYFVNRIADALKQKYPSLKIITLAYRFTKVPPKNLKPADNVVIQYSTIERSCIHPIDSPENKEIADNIKAWGKISKNLMIWDYSTNFDNYISPYPSLYVIGDDIRFFVKNKAGGILTQGDTHTFCSDMPELKSYLLAKLFWNPELDDKKLIKEFLDGYYGKAAPYIEEYLKLMNDSFLARNEKLSYKILYPDFPDIDTMEKCYEIFDKAAESVKNNKVILERITRARMPLDHIRLLRYKLLKRIADGKKHSSIVENYQSACEEFINNAKLFGTRKYSECEKSATHEARLRSIGRPDVELPSPYSLLPKENVLDIQDNMFSLIGTDNGWVKNISDPDASDKYAAYMPGNHTNWSIHFYISRDFLKICKGKWRCFVSVKTIKENSSFSIGIYDRKNNVDSVRMNTKNTNMKGYHYFDLGIHEFHSRMYVWAAPSGNSEADGIYIDRIFFVKDKASQKTD